HSHLESIDLSRSRVAEIQFPETDQHRQRKKDEEDHLQQRLCVEPIKPISAGQEESSQPLQIIGERIPSQGHLDAPVAANYVQWVELKPPGQSKCLHCQGAGQLNLQKENRRYRLLIADHNDKNPG